MPPWTPFAAGRKSCPAEKRRFLRRVSTVEIAEGIERTTIALPREMFNRLKAVMTQWGFKKMNHAFVQAIEEWIELTGGANYPPFRLCYVLRDAYSKIRFRKLPSNPDWTRRQNNSARLPFGDHEE